MLRALVLAGLCNLIWGGFAPLGAENAAPGAAAERFRFEVTDHGILRLDSRTGQISQCTVGASGAICRSAPDERAALEGEIARLEAENAGLKKALADRSLSGPPPIPPAEVPDAGASPGGEAQTTPDAPQGRLRAAFDTAWRHLVAMMSRMKGALQ